jgi:hypothetical protein
MVSYEVEKLNFLTRNCMRLAEVLGTRKAMYIPDHQMEKITTREHRLSVKVHQMQKIAVGGHRCMNEYQMLTSLACYRVWRVTMRGLKCTNVFRMLILLYC